MTCILIELIRILGATNQYYDSRTLRKVCGILGTIKLISGQYLVVATHREFVGVINNQVVWRLAGHDLIPFIPSLIHLSDSQVCSIVAVSWNKYVNNQRMFLSFQKVQNETYLSMMNQTLSTPFFYFSYTYDLTHSLQRINSVGPEFYEVGQMPIDRFDQIH